VKRATLDRLLASLAAQHSEVLATDLASGEQRLLEPAASPAAREVLRRDACLEAEFDGRRWFLAPFAPPLRMVVVGAVHIAQPLVQMAAVAGHAVTIVDPREAFATGARFPGVALVRTWPADALAALALDARTSVVALTHDPKLDDPALTAALRSPAYYVGALGSQKTHAARLARLRERGLSEAELARIHAPIGLAIGARSPAEIALAILAQVTQRLREPGAPVSGEPAA
jgi:xanthine dehydrogenase accessory factor